MQEAQTLSPENGHMIERLVRARIVYERAARDVAESGTVLKASKTSVPQVNPCWGIIQHRNDEVRLIEMGFEAALATVAGAAGRRPANSFQSLRTSPRRRCRRRSELLETGA